jgi:hypothetical protein
VFGRTGTLVVRISRQTSVETTQGSALCADPTFTTDCRLPTDPDDFNNLPRVNRYPAKKANHAGTIALSQLTIHGMPNRSTHIPKRSAQNVS